MAHLLPALLGLLMFACDGDPKGRGDTAQDPADLDADGDGATVGGGDCDDGDPGIHPGATETCDGRDNDCDGLVDDEDDDAVGLLEGWLDADGDGWGGGAPLTVCPGTVDLVGQGGDCDDGDPEVHPGVVERPDGVDQDCDGLVDDEDCGDGAENDGDGLVDCEDGDCVEPCTEATHCDDRIDNDGDGWTDCQDEDCWSDCTPSLRSRVHGGRMHMSNYSEITSWWHSGFASFFDGGHSRRRARADIASAWGTVQALTAARADARVRATCTWVVDGGYVEREAYHSDGDVSFTRASSQVTPTLAAGCEDYAGQSFIPHSLWPRAWAVDAGVYAWASGGWGMPYFSGWYTGDAYVGWRTSDSTARDYDCHSYWGAAHGHWERQTNSSTADVVLGISRVGFPRDLWP